MKYTNHILFSLRCGYNSFACSILRVKQMSFWTSQNYLSTEQGVKKITLITVISVSVTMNNTK